MRPRRSQKSIRLKGFDYRSNADYFVTLNSYHKRWLFGNVKNCRMHLSELGRIVDHQWRSMSFHNDRVVLGPYQIMPNHLHGIVTLKPLQGLAKGDCPRERAFGKPIPGSLSTILGSFKCGVTLLAHESGISVGDPIWGTRFFDHIIRDESSFFMIELYIELNPFIWEYDARNPRHKELTFDEYQILLRDRFGIPEILSARLLNQKMMAQIGIKLG